MTKGYGPPFADVVRSTCPGLWRRRPLASIAALQVVGIRRTGCALGGGTRTHPPGDLWHGCCAVQSSTCMATRTKGRRPFDMCVRARGVRELGLPRLHTRDAPQVGPHLHSARRV